LVTIRILGQEYNCIGPEKSTPVAVKSLLGVTLDEVDHPCWDETILGLHDSRSDNNEQCAEQFSLHQVAKTHGEYLSRGFGDLHADILCDSL